MELDLGAVRTFITSGPVFGREHMVEKIAAADMNAPGSPVPGVVVGAVTILTVVVAVLSTVIPIVLWLWMAWKCDHPSLGPGRDDRQLARRPGGDHPAVAALVVLVLPSRAALLGPDGDKRISRG